MGQCFILLGLCFEFGLKCGRVKATTWLKYLKVSLVKVCAVGYSMVTLVKVRSLWLNLKYGKLHAVTLVKVQLVLLKYGQFCMVILVKVRLI